MRSLRLTLAEIRHHPRRLVGVVIAVVLSVAFLTSSLVLVSTEQHAFESDLIAPYAHSDVLVRTNTDVAPTKARIDAVTAGIAAVKGVAAVEPLWQGYAQASSPQQGNFSITTAPTDPRFRWAELAEGKWPSAAGEAAISSDTANRHRLALGDTITLDLGTPLSVRVTGIVAGRHSVVTGLSDQLFLAPATLVANPSLAGWPNFVVAAEPGTDPAALRDSVEAASRSLLPGSDSTVQTTAEFADESVRELTGGFAVFGALLLGFAVIAMLVTTIIIANTFQIIVAQRQRQLALLRVVGADARQVRRSLLLESLIVGFVSSMLGVAVGVGLAASVTAFTGGLVWGLQVPWGQVLLAALFGTAVTLIGALGPARRAMAVSPMAALRPPSQHEGRQSSRVRAVVASVLAALGLALIVPAVTLVTGMGSLLLAVAGSALLALGILLAARFVIPPAIRLLGGPAARLGAPGELAVSNALRNPARSSATGVALMLAIGLVVTLQVGAASITESAAAQFDSTFPVDLVASTPELTVSAEQLDRIQKVAGVARAELVPIRTVTVGDQSLSATGLNPDTPVVASGLTQLDDTHVLAQQSLAKTYGWKAGDRLTFGTDENEPVTTLTLAFSPAAPADRVVMTTAVLARFAPAGSGEPAGTEAWIALAPNADVASVISEVRAAMGPDGYVDGTAVTRQLLQNVLNVLVGIASGLMGVAVLIALIGVGNTVSLSVVERAREIALLRALGLQRRQLRLSLVIECVLLALAGCLVGIAAGIGFGWLGTVALLRSSNQEMVRLTVSWPPTLAVALVAVLAGALAALPPARQALKATPAQVLADD